jgi:hypothetical protein
MPRRTQRTAVTEYMKVPLTYYENEVEEWASSKLDGVPLMSQDIV